MPVPYDFKRVPRGTPRRKNGFKGLRFFALLCVVAAVTAGVVMLIVPRKAENNPGSGAEDKTTPASGESTVAPGGDVSQGNSGSTESRGNTGSVDGGGTAVVSGETGTSGNGGNSEIPPSGGGNDTPGKKGVAGSGDLSAGEDKPVYRPGQAPGIEGVSAQIRRSSNVDEAVALCREFLMKEYSAGGEFSENWNTIGTELAALMRKKWQERNWKHEAVTHKVVARDHLIKISRRNDATVEGIKFINKRKNNFLRIGEKLTVVPGPWRITVSRKARLLNIWRKEKNSWNIFAVFPVGVGRKNSTPVGNFIINHRLRHPKWYGPDGRVFAYGDKENPLGDYFLKLRQVTPDGVKKDKGYGIHGSGDDASVGRSLSNGCLRMHNQDVEILYYLLPGGCPVKIVD